MEKGLIILFGLTMLYLASTGRIATHVRILILQGAILFLICCANFARLDLPNSIFLSLETLGVKTVLIPWFLFRVLRKHAALRDDAPGKAKFFPLFAASVILLLGVLSHRWIALNPIIAPVHFGVSVSAIIISLMLITVKRNIVSSITCFIAMENGIFLLSLSIAKEMPLLVNMGVLLDLFADVFILGMFINLIHKEFKDLDVSKLSDLKDCEND